MSPTTKTSHQPIALGSTVLITLETSQRASMAQFNNKLGVVTNISDITGTGESVRFLVNLGHDPKHPSLANHLLCTQDELTIMTPEKSVADIVSIAQIRDQAQSVVDWFQYRLDHGDILLDAWMEPSFDAAKEIINQVNKLQHLGWNTFPDTTPTLKKPGLFTRLLAAFRG